MWNACFCRTVRFPKNYIAQRSTYIAQRSPLFPFLKNFIWCYEFQEKQLHSSKVTTSPSSSRLSVCVCVCGASMGTSQMINKNWDSGPAGVSKNEGSWPTWGPFRAAIVSGKIPSSALEPSLKLEPGLSAHFFAMSEEFLEHGNRSSGNRL